MGILVSSWPHPSPRPTWDKLYTPEGDAPMLLLLVPQLLSTTSSHQIFSRRERCTALAHVFPSLIFIRYMSCRFSQIQGSSERRRHLGLTQVPFPECHCWTGWDLTFKGSYNDGVLLCSVKSVPDRCLWLRMLGYQTGVFCLMLIIATALLSGPQTPSVMDQGSHIFSAISHTKKAQRLKCETLSLWVFCVSGFCWRSICLSVRMMCRMVVSVWICVDLFQHDCHIHIRILKAWKKKKHRFSQQPLAVWGSCRNIHLCARVRTVLFCPLHLFELVDVTLQTHPGVSLGRLAASQRWQSREEKKT